MPSIIRVIGTWIHEKTQTAQERCVLDNRYGTGFFDVDGSPVRGPYSRKTAEEMAHADDLIEAAGILPGDRIEIQVEMWSTGERKWIKPTYAGAADAVFLAIDNGRFCVKGAPGTPFENERWAILQWRDIHGLESLVDVRKEQ